MVLQMVMDKVTAVAARQYAKALARPLQQFGLRYEDIINDDEKEVKEALELAHPDVVTGRTRRQKRAIDLSFKRKNFLDYAPNVEQDTFKTEFLDDVEKIMKRDQEYAMLNAHNK